MDRSSQPRTVKNFKTGFEKGTVNFDHVIQRAYGSWSLEQKTLWIHSLASNWPVPTMMCRKIHESIEINGQETEQLVAYMLEGKHRSLTTFKFIDDEFKLASWAPPVTIDGVTYDISNKYFSELDEEVRDAILSYNMSIMNVDATDEEIEELFYRWNNGSPLNKAQQGKALMGTAWATRFNELANHPFIQNKAGFTASELARATHEECFKQVMLLMDSEDNATSFGGPYLFEYTQEFKEDETNKLHIFEQLKPVFDYLDQAFDKKENVLFKKLHFPASFTVAKYALENSIHPDEFYDWAQCFKSDIDKHTESPKIETNYRSFMGQGSTHKRKVVGRVSSMMEHFKAYFHDKGFSNHDLMQLLKQRLDSIKTA